MAPISSSPPNARGHIARQVALAFGAIGVIAVIMATMLLGIIDDVSDLVAGMRHDEASIQQGLTLATASRSVETHLRRAMRDPAGPHLDRYRALRESIRADLERLGPRLPDAARWRLDALDEAADEIHALVGEAFHERVPEAGALARLDRALSPLADGLTEHGDAIGRAASSQMAHAHVLATDSTELGLIIGLLCIGLVVVLSVGFTLRLRATVIKPMLRLTEGARRVGRGDFSARVELSGNGELAALGGAFDRMADELARREARLVQTERMAAIGQLAAGVAHELNNPIGIIRGYLKTMRPDEDPEVLAEELAILDEEASHCQRIARDLVAYARTDELSLAPIPMEAFLTEAGARFSEGPSGGVPLEVEAEPAVVEGDRVRLRQVVLNLLTNAAQASEAAQARGPVRLEGVSVPGGYQIRVLDQGAGVPPEDRERVFEPFFSKRPGGSGLGLAVCQGIIQGHRGQISVEDGPQSGALFIATLPRAPQEAS